jgi:hypothetical protein
MMGDSHAPYGQSIGVAVTAAVSLIAVVMMFFLLDVDVVDDPALETNAKQLFVDDNDRNDRKTVATVNGFLLIIFLLYRNNNDGNTVFITRYKQFQMW